MAQYTEAQLAQVELDRELAKMLLDTIGNETNHMQPDQSFASAMSALTMCIGSMIAVGPQNDVLTDLAASMVRDQVLAVIKQIRHG